MGIFNSIKNVFKSKQTRETQSIAEPLEEEERDGIILNKEIDLILLGKYEEAIEYVDKALEINPRDVASLTNKGTALDKLGSYEEAIECYDKALEINPNDWIVKDNKNACLQHMLEEQTRETQSVAEPIEAWSKGYKIDNRYEILDIKEGGMGIVYISCDRESYQIFAIKTFKKEYLWDEAAINRFMREAETWVNLDLHDNIVRASVVKKIEGKPFIFLEYIDGGDLTSYIGKLDVPKAVDFASQFCVGMDYAYDKSGIIPRDIKPSNVMITNDGILKITDFGLVKSLDYDIEEIESKSIPENMSLTKTGVVAGTPPYMSPEQFIDTKRVGIESDIYSFGVMFYEMLTEKLPFYAHNFIEYKAKHLKEISRKPSEINPSIPAKLDFIVMKCLEKNPDDRYHCFGEIYKELTGEELEGEEQELGEVGWTNKGVSMNTFGRYEEAIKCHDKALEINPRSYVAWTNKGYSLSKLNRDVEAIECFDKALEINPSENAWGGKGVSLSYLGRYEEAVECHDKALEINPRYDNEWYNKAYALSCLKRYEEAIECQDRALEINPRNESLWDNKGVSLVTLGKYEEAIECYDNDLEIKPRYDKAWYNKGRALTDLDRYEEAIECYDMALKINPRDEFIWAYKGTALFCLEMYEEAIECFDKVLEINPNDETTRDNRKICLQQLKSS